VAEELRIEYSPKRVNNERGVNPDIPDQFLSENGGIAHIRSGR
jgi:hypothetical protein